MTKKYQMIKKIFKIPFILLIFFPSILLLKLINLFFEMKIGAINSLLGGNIDLYTYIIKKREGFYDKKVHIFFIEDYEKIISNYDLYNEFWLEKLFDKLSPIKISNKKLFFIFNLYLHNLMLFI